MEEWQHCAKEWVWIPVETAVENIVNGSIVKCKYRGREYYDPYPILQTQ